MMKNYLINLVILLIFIGCGGGGTNTDTSTNTDKVKLKVQHLPMKNILLSAKPQSGLHIGSYLYLDGDSITILKDGNETKYSILTIGGENLQTEYIDQNTTVFQINQYKFVITKDLKNSNIVTVYPYENGISLGGYNYNTGNLLNKSSAIPMLNYSNKDSSDDYLNNKRDTEWIKDSNDVVKSAKASLPWYRLLVDNYHNGKSFQEIAKNVEKFFTKKIAKIKIEDDTPYIPSKSNTNDSDNLEEYPETGVIATFKEIPKKIQDAIAYTKKMSITVTEKLKELQENSQTSDITEKLKNIKDIGLFIDTDTITETKNSKKANYYLATQKDKFVSQIDANMLIKLESNGNNITEGMEIEANKLGITNQQLQDASVQDYEGMIGSLSQMDFDITFEEYYVKHYGKYPPKIPNVDTMETPNLDESIKPDIPSFSSNYLVYILDGTQKGGLLNNFLIHKNDESLGIEPTDYSKGIHAIVRLEYNQNYSGTAETFIFSSERDYNQKTDFLFLLPTSPARILSFIKNSAISSFSLASLQIKGLKICPIREYSLYNNNTFYDYKNVLDYKLNDNLDYISGEVNAVMYQNCTSIEEERGTNGENDTWIVESGEGNPHNVRVLFRFNKKYIHMLQDAKYTEHYNTYENFSLDYESYEDAYPNHKQESVPNFYIGKE